MTCARVWRKAGEACTPCESTEGMEEAVRRARRAPPLPSPLHVLSLLYAAPFLLHTQAPAGRWLEEEGGHGLVHDREAPTAGGVAGEGVGEVGGVACGVGGAGRA